MASESKRPDRRRRLEAALRENLKRRKVQSRGRADGASRTGSQDGASRQEGAPQASAQDDDSTPGGPRAGRP